MQLVCTICSLPVRPRFDRLDFPVIVGLAVLAGGVVERVTPPAAVPHFACHALPDAVIVVDKMSLPPSRL